MAGNKEASSSRSAVEVSHASLPCYRTYTTSAKEPLPGFRFDPACPSVVDLFIRELADTSRPTVIYCFCLGAAAVTRTNDLAHECRATPLLSAACGNRYTRKRLSPSAAAAALLGSNPMKHTPTALLLLLVVERASSERRRSLRRLASLHWRWTAAWSRGGLFDQKPVDVVTGLETL